MIPMLQKNSNREVPHNLIFCFYVGLDICFASRLGPRGLREDVVVVIFLMSKCFHLRYHPLVTQAAAAWLRKSTYLNVDTRPRSLVVHGLYAESCVFEMGPRNRIVATNERPDQSGWLEEEQKGHTASVDHRRRSL